MMAIAERMSKLAQSIERAMQALHSDGGASPVLAAVVKELEKKLGKALDPIQEIGRAHV